MLGGLRGQPDEVSLHHLHTLGVAHYGCLFSFSPLFVQTGIKSRTSKQRWRVVGSFEGRWGVLDAGVHYTE